MIIRALALAGLFLTACASSPVTPAASVESADPGVYMIVLGRVFDRPAFMQGYAAKLSPLYERFGGSYIALTGQPGILEGSPSFESIVISHWPSEAAVRAFWTSAEYEQLIFDRTENNWGEFTVVIVPVLPSAR